MRAPPRPLVAFVAGLAVLACLLACGGMGNSMRQAAGNQKQANDLRQLSVAYHNFHDSNQRGPSSPEEWVKIAGSPDERALIARTGPSGDIVFYWNVKITQLTAGAVNTVLGYEKKVPSEGGLVLMADGAVKQMTAQEFASAPKAGDFVKK